MRIISADTYSHMVTDVQKCTNAREFRAFLRNLIDELYLGDGNTFTKDDKEVFMDDLKQCLDITMETGADNFWMMDTAIRDRFLDAVMKGE